MGVKSIIDVEIQSAEWEKFERQFDRYSEQLRKQPDIWKKITAAHEQFAGSFAKLGDKIAPIADTHADLTTAAEDQEKALDHSAELWGGIAGASGRTARNVEGATKGLLKWAGIFAGVGTVLGGLGLDAMMHFGGDVFGWRKSATGLGLSIGQERAFNITYSQLLSNPGAFLSGVNTGQTDITSPAYRAMQMLGVNPNQPAGQASAAMMQKIFNLAHTLPKGMIGQYSQILGLGAFGISAEDMMRYRSMSPAQFAQQQALAAAEARLLNLSNATSLAWTNFLIKMELAKGGIENVFIKLLTPLAGPLGRLTVGFEHLLQVLFVQNGPIAKDIDAFAKWIGKLNNKDFETFGADLKDAFGSFTTGIKDMALLMHQVATHPLKPWTWGIPLPNTQGGVAGGLLNGVSQAAANMWHNNPGDLKWAPGFAKFGGWNNGGWAAFHYPEQGLNAMAYQLHLDALRGGSTVKGIVSAYDPGDKNLPSYIQSVSQQLGVSPTASLNLGIWRVLADLMRAMLRVEQGFSPHYGNAIAGAAQSVSSRFGVIEIRDKTSLGVVVQTAAHGATP